MIFKSCEELNVFFLLSALCVCGTKVRRNFGEQTLPKPAAKAKAVANNKKKSAPQQQSGRERQPSPPPEASSTEAWSTAASVAATYSSARFPVCRFRNRRSQRQHRSLPVTR